MVDLVSLEFVKVALRIAEWDGTGQILPHEDDEVLRGYLAAATEAILRYLKRSGDGWDVDTVPGSVRQSIVIAVQSMYDPDRIELLTGIGTSDPKNPIVAMLCMMRDPTVT